MKKLWIVFILVLLSQYSYAQKKKVLILNSYSRDFTWTEGQINGINSELKKSNMEIETYYEYMDTKNINNHEYINIFYEYFAKKYKGKKFDLIFTTDDNALLFMLENKKILKNEPYIIATGINNRIENIGDKVSVLYEAVDLDKNVKLAIKQNKYLENIYMVLDDTKTSEGLKVEAKKLIEKYKDINFILLDGKYEKLIEQLKFIDENSVIYHIVYFKNEEGLTSKYSQAVKKLYEDIRVPIYTSFDFYLEEDNNILGGYVLDGYLMGVKAGKLALDFFEGKELPVYLSDEDCSRYQFNDKILKKLKLKYKPINSKYLFEEKGYIEMHIMEIVMLFVSIVIISIVLLLVYKNLNIQKEINEKNQKIMKLDKEVVETQNEIITRLGEVIETRSQETANHVVRVAKISRLLGELAGLNKTECDTLEAASPLHDVGKIAIPESILNKPANLTYDEFEIVKRHTSIGHNILMGSRRPLMTAAAVIAYEHHEKWDGSGYPRGLKGEDISIYARITSISDVFDALLSKRIYKEPWSLEETVNFIKNGKGKMFDPRLVELFLDNFEEVLELRDSLID